MPKEAMGGSVVQYQWFHPEDRIEMLRSGIVWKLGPKQYEIAAKYVIDHPELVDENTPQEVVDAVNSQQEQDPWS